jgi:hypothetical protein
MENTTEQNESAPQNWYNAAIIFAKALGFMLDEGHGVIVDLSENLVIVGDEDVKKVIVFKKDGSVHIGPVDQDIPEGTFVTLNPEDSEKTEE